MNRIEWPLFFIVSGSGSERNLKFSRLAPSRPLYLTQYSFGDSDDRWQLISTLMPKAFENMDFSREHCFIVFYPFRPREQM